MAQPRSERTHARPRHRSQWPTWTLIAVLLVAVLAGTLWVPLYNRTTPAVAGFPFFYWYQLLWVPVVALVSWCAYLLSKRVRRGAAPPAPPLSAPTAADPPLRAPAQPASGAPGPGERTAPAPGSPPPLPKRQVPPRTEES